MSLPLEGITVLDFTQLLSGPSASLRLADLGARVIKVEQKGKGDLSRHLYGESYRVHGESAFYQAINRNKESIELDLKTSKQDIQLVQELIKKADVLLHNFRPQVMERLGLSYEQVKALNPALVYGSISGYGQTGPWSFKPGQDLLVQALSGLVWQTGSDQDGPVPMGLALADMFAGGQLVQGVLAGLVSGEGTLVEVSMLEAMLDFQFEPLTLYYQDGEPVTRGDVNGAHPLVAAPYGLYKTQDGYLVLAMGSILTLGALFESQELLAFDDPSVWYTKRDEIKSVLKALLLTNTTQHWLSILEPADIWCAEVFNWEQLLAHDGFKVLNLLQTVTNAKGEQYQTTRCPIRIDSEVYTNNRAAPLLGENTAKVRAEFTLIEEEVYS
ncbi:CoA transferase [Vibrio astriarenae]|uniref:CoA transferase n=1 Tax=Vibrio astriarenae TaxID=1481923 RepID=A0A7Z2T3F1_9VIBR|nr:CaiB/BaiF CoA-transferase family protein [Vibrio astriarenae]QIA63567.1 CoA transferase [Vibrio astriarenae]